MINSTLLQQFDSAGNALLPIDSMNSRQVAFFGEIHLCQIANGYRAERS
jgi:hypothetical protein